MSGAKNSYAGKVKPRKPSPEELEHRSDHDDLGILRQKLTDKQRTFVYEYVVNQVSGTEAARRAGYKHPNVRAAELLNDKPYVAERINQFRLELQRKYEVTYENHVEQLAKLRDVALQNGAYSAAVNAEKARGQVGGLYVDRKEILVGRIDSMNRDDVVRRLQEIHNQYRPLIDVTPVEELGNEGIDSLEKTT
jgi:phage terminase small subunit|tara:strand:- start:1296 stop:1874 length:579 start_codon:yes stop_codon:yes gene_type:complete